MGLKKVGWFTTGRDEAALELLTKIYGEVEKGFVPVEVAYVFLSRENEEGVWVEEIVKFCQEKNIKVIQFSAKKFLPELRRTDLEAWRREYHAEVLKRIDVNVDFGLLAGYMWIVSEEFCKVLNLINLHPALPGGPKGAWEDVMWQLISARAFETGAMMHKVTPDLDEGPAISYFRIKLRTQEFVPLWEEAEQALLRFHLSGVREKWGEDFPLFKRIREEELKREVPLIVLTLKAIAEDRIQLTGGNLPVDLTEEVEEYLSSRS